MIADQIFTWIFENKNEQHECKTISNSQKKYRFGFTKKGLNQFLIAVIGKVLR